MDILKGFVGIAVVIGVAYLFSSDRRRIDWRLIGGGLLLQIFFALAVLYVPFVSTFFQILGKVFIKLMEFTGDGLAFLLGPYALKANGFSFLLHSLPIVIFFSALVSLFYHWGIIQRVVGAMAWLLQKFMRNISGAEGLVVSGNIFLGMTESPVLIKNYLPTMNCSEIFLVMVAGMATIAGSVMGTYVSLLGNGDPEAQLLFATHLLSASVMAVPGSIVIAKVMCPQTEPTHDVEGGNEAHSYLRNILSVIASGTQTGVKLMVNIAAMLLVFIALVALLNYILSDLIGHYTGLNDLISRWTDGKATGLTFQFLLGLITSPVMWLIGVPVDDIMVVGSLLGQKTILNEFVAYMQMQQWREAGLFVSEKSIIMSTYLLCGFANISSIGILLGGLGVLAPTKREIVSRLGFRSMIGGMLVAILSATIVGMMI